MKLSAFFSSVGNLVKKLGGASPAARAFAAGVFADASAAIPDPIVEPGGQITPNQAKVLRGRALSYMKALPGQNHPLDVDKLAYGNHVGAAHVAGRWWQARLRIPPSLLGVDSLEDCLDPRCLLIGQAGPPDRSGNSAHRRPPHA